MDRAVDQIDLASVLALSQKKNLVNAVTIARAKKKSTLRAYSVRLIRLIIRTRQRWIDETLTVAGNVIGVRASFLKPAEKAFKLSVHRYLKNNPRLTNDIAAQ